jgi:hypothetical protein
MTELNNNIPLIKEIEARLAVIRKLDRSGKPLKGEELYQNRKEILTLIGKLR